MMLVFPVMVSCQPGVKLDHLDSPRLVGPLLGHVSYEEANFWAYAGPGARFRIEYWPRAEPQRVMQVEFEANASANHSAKVKLESLTPTTIYDYRLIELSSDDQEATGQFRTAPLPGTSGRFNLAAASCMRYDNDQQAWVTLASKEPSLLLLLGDNVYSETTSPDQIRSHHLRYRTVPEFARIIATTPTYAIWDDHDFAGDNAAGDTPGKEDSLRVFNEVWVNPGAGTQDTLGIFHSFRWGDVEFFMLDTRYHRSPNIYIDNDDKRMLGDAQFEWLKEGLLASTATFKIIASGSTLKAALTDSWRRYGFSRERVFATIMENDVNGALFLTGDLHRCQIDEHDSGVEGGYPIVEVISSGITRGSPTGFVTIEFDTTIDDPSLTILVWKGDGQLQERRVIPLSELQVRGG